MGVSSVSMEYPVCTGSIQDAGLSGPAGKFPADWDKVVTLFLSRLSKPAPHPLPTTTLLFPVPAPFFSRALDFVQHPACVCDVCARLPPQLEAPASKDLHSVCGSAPQARRGSVHNYRKNEAW